MNEIREKFNKESKGLYHQRVKLFSFLSVTIFAFFGLLDYFVFPDKLDVLFKLRLLNGIVAGTIYFAAKTNFGKKHPVFLGISVCLSLGFIISAMVIKTGGHQSIYYAGLIVIMLGTYVLTSFGIKELSLAYGLIYLSYILPIIIFDKITYSHLLINSNFFILCTIFLCLISSFFGNRLRFQEFQARYNLAEARDNLEKAYGKLKELDNLKTQFFSNISHEFRTPLTLILAPIESILKGEGRNLTPQDYNLAETIHSNTLRLLKLINNLLDLSKIDAGKMIVNYEKLKLNEFIRGIIAEISHVAEKKKLSLKFIEGDDIPPFCFDPDKIEKVLLNIIYNSIKFTDEGGKIIITSHREDNNAVVKIKDTGIGIEEKDLGKIFDRFVQIDGSQKRRYEGTGIGLPIAKELVELHKGSIDAESKVGKCTTITFSLPLVLEYERKQSSIKEDDWTETQYRDALYSTADIIKPIVKEKQSVKYVTNSKKILVVEDNVDMLNFIAFQLEQEYRVFKAYDGKEGFEITQKEIPDLIIADIMMPLMDGYELCQKIKDNDRTRHIPIIFLTAKVGLDMKIEGLEKGADEYLVKPFNTEELRARVKSLLNLRRLEQEIQKRNEELEKTLNQLKETQVQLVHSEKMASLGQLVAGIAHEINNPINASIMGINALEKYIDKKKKYITDESIELEIKDTTSTIKNSLWQTAEIVADLRDFSKKDTTGFKLEDIHKGLDSTLLLLHHRFEGRISIHKNYDTEIGNVECSLGQLNQVFLNILQNAVDAIKDKGEIWITTTKNAEKVRISIKDNGIGIKEEDLKHVFDPFFTTKDVGEGVGLGMSISYGLIQNHNGSIDVKSKHGEGTEIIITIPLEHKGGRI